MNKIPGMTEDVLAKRHPINGFQWVDNDGRPYATMMNSGKPEQQTLISEFGIFRGHLAKILFDLTAENKNVNYIFDEQVASLQQKQTEEGPITVEFQNGTPTAEYDLVVACDGSTSRTRALGFNCGVRDHIKPLNSWVAFYSINDEIVSPKNPVGLAYNAPKGSFIGVGPDPAGGNRGAIITSYPNGDPEALAPFREAQKLGEDALKAYVDQRYRGAGWKVDELLDSIQHADDFYASETVQVKMAKLSIGRFVLVGDAGYAPGITGTGTSMAMCGGYVLAGEIMRHSGDLKAGLQAYEERMEPIIKDMQKMPPGLPGFMAPQTEWGLMVRNVVLRIVCFGMARFGGLFSWVNGLYAPALAKDKYNLPDYEWVA